MLPGFDARGYLPAGIHAGEWHEFTQILGFNVERREMLLELNSFLQRASHLGGLRVLIDGSFVTLKESPNDIDLVLILPSDFDFSEQQVSELYRVAEESRLHLFVALEGDVTELRRWSRFFGIDRDEIPRGIVELRL